MKPPRYGLLSKMFIAFSMGCLVVFALAYLYVDDVSAGVKTLIDNLLAGVELL